jgi:hypothetical protein
MAKPQKSRAAAPEDRIPPPPPARRLGPCPTCGCTVLADAWTQEPLRPVGPCTRPVTGEPHDCALALLQHAARWQYWVRLHPGVPAVYTLAASR